MQPPAPKRTRLRDVSQVQTLSRRPQAPTEKRQATEAAVLTAMEELLGEGTPYAALSVERIATRAGISRTAFYFYFADKRELLMRLAAELSTSSTARPMRGGRAPVTARSS